MGTNTLINVLVTVAVVALLWWLLTFLPVPEPIRTILTVVFVVLAIVWIIRAVAGGARRAP